MKAHRLVGISGLDTRALVRHLREAGAMNGVISSDGRSPAELFEELSSVPSMQGLNLADRVSTRQPYQWNEACRVGFDQRLHKRSDGRFQVVAIDFGIKRAILDRLVGHGCAVTGPFQDLQAEEGHRFGMVQLQAPLQASLSEQGGGHHQQFVFLLGREMHHRAAASDTLAKKREP